MRSNRAYGGAGGEVDGRARVTYGLLGSLAVAHAPVVDGPEALVVVLVPEEHEVDALRVVELLRREQVRLAERNTHARVVVHRLAVLLVARTRAVHRPVADHYK